MGGSGCSWRYRHFELLSIVFLFFCFFCILSPSISHLYWRTGRSQHDWLDACLHRVHIAASIVNAWRKGNNVEWDTYLLSGLSACFYQHLYRCDLMSNARSYNGQQQQQTDGSFWLAARALILMFLWDRPNEKAEKGAGIERDRPSFFARRQCAHQRSPFE